MTGLRKYFKVIISRNALDESKGYLLLGGDPAVTCDFGDDFCLIDDQSWDSDHVLIKMNFFGIDVRPLVAAKLAGTPLDTFAPLDDHFIHASPYAGDPDDDYFLRLLEAFKDNYSPEKLLTA